VQYWDWETLHGPFLLDDRGTVSQNPSVIEAANPKSWARVWTHDYWGHDKLTLPSSHKSFRPITTLSYRWNFIFTGLDTFWYRLTNVIMHAVVCFLTVPTVLLSQPASRPWEALGGALTFAVHPVHAESVSNITGRAEVLAALFFMLGFICYTTAHEQLPSGAWRARSVVRFLVAYMLASVCMVLSLLSKETGITTLVVCAIWDAVIACGFNLHTALSGWAATSAEVRCVWRGWAVRTAMLAVMTIAVGIWRLWLNGESGATFIAEQNPAAAAESRLERGLSYSWIYIRNLGLLVYPHQLCCDWTGGAIPNVESLGDWRVKWIALLYGSFASWLVWVLRKRAQPKDADDKVEKVRIDALECCKKDTVMAMTWLILPFLMSMNLITVVGFVMADRVLYLSALGWCMCLPTLPRILTLVVQSSLASPSSSVQSPAEPDASSGEGKPASEQPGLRRFRHYLAVAVMAIMATYSYLCHYQNRVWRNESSLWGNGYSVNPKGHLIMSDWGKSLANEGRYLEAIGVLEVAMDRSPGTVTLMGSLGLSYAYTGRCDKAMPFFQRGLLYSSQGEGLSDNLSGTIEEGKQQVMVGIFYVGYSHCATNLQSMLDYVKKALEVHPTSSFAMDHMVKVTGIVQNVYRQSDRGNKLDLRMIEVIHAPGPDGKRKLDFRYNEAYYEEQGGEAAVPAVAVDTTILPPKQHQKIGDLYSGHTEELHRLLFKLVHKAPAALANLS